MIFPSLVLVYLTHTYVYVHWAYFVNDLLDWLTYKFTAKLSFFHVPNEIWPMKLKSTIIWSHEYVDFNWKPEIYQRERRWFGFSVAVVWWKMRHDIYAYTLDFNRFKSRRFIVLIRHFWRQKDIFCTLHYTYMTLVHTYIYVTSFLR